MILEGRLGVFHRRWYPTGDTGGASCVARASPASHVAYATEVSMSKCRYLHMYICTHVCMYTYLCLYVSMSLCLYVSMSLCLYVSMSLCLYVSMSLCLYVSMSLCLEVTASAEHPASAFVLSGCAIAWGMDVIPTSH